MSTKITMCGAVFLFASSLSDANSDVQLCDVLQNGEQYVNRDIAFDALALAGSHPYEIVLTDLTCDDRFVVVSGGAEHKNDRDLISLLKMIYPHYPDDDVLVETKIAVHASGKLVFRKSRGLLTKFLELKSIRTRP